MKDCLDTGVRVAISAGLLVLAVACSGQIPTAPTGTPPLPAETATTNSVTSTPAAAPTMTALPRVIATQPPTIAAQTTIIVPQATVRSPGQPVTLAPTQATSKTPGPLTVTLADEGKTLPLRAGERFLLALPAEFNWQVTLSDESVISPVPNSPSDGNQGLYETRRTGSATLTAGGTPKCYTATPRCLMPSRMFQVRFTISGGTPVAQARITLDDDSKTVSFTTGQAVTLVLAANYRWKVNVADEGVLAAIPNSPTPGGTTWLFKANRAGKTELEAQGSIICPPGQVCPMVIREFRVTVIVR